MLILVNSCLGFTFLNLNLPKVHLPVTDKPVCQLPVSSSIFLAQVQVGFRVFKLQVASTAWSEFWQQTTFPPGIPPSLPNTPSLKFICHLLITELVNASPAAPLSFQSAYCCSVSSLLLLQIICALLCCQFPSAASWWWNNTLVYKLPLWFRHKCYCNCLVSWFIELCFCSSVGSLHGQASVRVTWWPQRDPSTELSVVLWWPSLHNCSSLCSCA